MMENQQEKARRQRKEEAAEERGEEAKQTDKGRGVPTSKGGRGGAGGRARAARAAGSGGRCYAAGRQSSEPRLLTVFNWVRLNWTSEQMKYYE